MESQAEWYVVSCSECGQSLGGFDNEELAEASAIAEQKNCSSCGAPFSKLDDGRTWNFRVKRMSRPAPKSGVHARIVSLDDSKVGRIRALSPIGPLLLLDIEELNAVSRGGWPNATMALWGKVLDGAIKFRGRQDGWWKEEWDRETLGWVFRDQKGPCPFGEIKSRVPVGLLGRVQDKIKYLRNSGAHQNYTRVTDVEAYGAIEALSEFLDVWF